MRAVPKTTGFTLVELVITVAVIFVALSVGVPTFGNISLNNKRMSTMNEMVLALNIARSEAIKRGETVSMCPSANGTACTDDPWHTGWIVFVNSDGDEPAAVDSGETILRAYNIDGAKFTFQGSGYFSGGVTFLNNGLLRGVGNVGYCDQRGSDSARRVSVNITGGVTVDKGEEEQCSGS